MTFDLNKEVFKCGINLPVTTFGTSLEDIKDMGADARITDLNDSIAVIIYKNYKNNCKMNLWMLDDEACFCKGGIEASWTLVLDIDLSLLVPFVHGYFISGDILLLHDDDWCLYDPDTKELRDFSHWFLMDHCSDNKEMNIVEERNVTDHGDESDNLYFEDKDDDLDFGNDSKDESDVDDKLERRKKG
ncbi:hypothetical protein POM88_040826 [Heracleum sosnowskyi]|uniref:Uncharacterized protein n=1 Tax=Heracleum sosnowskyi TaxID=360622 RepID=A0AAD8M7Q5_9APIA|nr:hypothetical protein POM88_040826 [Heracleum sosnowskyi]